MKVSKFKEMTRIEEWKSLIARRLESKLSVSDWCKKKRYYRTTILLSASKGGRNDCR